MVGMVVLIAYLANLNDNEKRIVAVLNESEYLKNDFRNTKSTSYINFKDIPLQVAKDSTIALGLYGLLHIPDGLGLKEVANNSFFYTADNPSTTVLGGLESVFQKELREAKLVDLGISTKEFEEMGNGFEINIETFSGERNLKGVDIIKAFIGGAFGYLIMMFIIIYGGFVMRSVIEEKTNRIIEIIISSVKPFQLMLGKIIGTSLAGIAQFVIWIVLGFLLSLIAFFVFDIDANVMMVDSDMSESIVKNAVHFPGVSDSIALYIYELLKIPWVTLISFFLIYFVLGYLIYSSIYAAIGAVVDNETDTQQFILPIIMPLILAVYVGFFSVFDNPHGPIAVGFSLFPLTSPIIMLMRLPNGIGEGGVPLWQVLLSILALIVTFIGIVRLATKIYRVGIIMYGKKPSYKEIYKWLKY